MIAAEAGSIATGLHIDYTSNPSLAMIVVAYASVAVFYSFIRFDERLSQALVTVGQLMLMMLFGILCTYAATKVAMPYRDAELLAVDQLMGFDRTSYVRLLTDGHWKIFLTNCIYLAMLPQLALVSLILVTVGRVELLQRFAVAYGLALCMTTVIFMFVPAVGAFVYFDLTPAQYASLPDDIYTPARTLDALRAGTVNVIPLNNLEGLIAFPSFHTIAAILYAWALWPVKLIRFPILALNLAIISTTPVGGAHYLADVLAGFVVAVVAVVASGAICRNKVELPRISSVPLAQSV